MDRRQRNFLIVIASLVALFALVLYILNTIQQVTIPEPISQASPTQESTPAGTPTQPAPPPATATQTQVPEAGTAAPSQIPEEAPAFYVSPDGSPNNDGSKAHPWSLQHALDHPDSVQPGDTIWLAGGKYIGSFTCQLKGAEGEPIHVRAESGQRVTLANDDRVLDIAESHYVYFWDLEITSTENNRDPQNPDKSAYGVRINQGEPSHDIKFINMVIHDMPAQGFGFWQANSNSEIYGSLIFFNGITQLDHGIYVHNTDGEKRIVDNIIFDNASHGIHAYGEKDYQQLNNIIIEGNTVFDNGSIGVQTKTGKVGMYKRNILMGGLVIAKNPVIKENYTYFPSTSSTGESFNLGYRAGTENAVVEDNYFAGGAVSFVGVNAGVKVVQNTMLGQRLAAIQGLTLGQNDFLLGTPNGPKIFVRPNKYEPGRANITVYNWEKAPNVVLSSSDLQEVQIQKGDQYELRNVQDYYNDIITGTYDGQQIDIPMTGRGVAQPLGLSFKPDSTFPEFGAFVLVVVPAGQSEK